MKLVGMMKDNDWERVECLGGPTIVFPILNVKLDFVSMPLAQMQTDIPTHYKYVIIKQICAVLCSTFVVVYK
jgi:hypothetical protein